MREDTVKSLRPAFDKNNEELNELEKQVSKAETWLSALAVIALIFGIAGGVGWSTLNTAREQLTTLEGGGQESLRRSGGSWPLETRSRDSTDRSQ